MSRGSDGDEISSRPSGDVHSSVLRPELEDRLDAARVGLFHLHLQLHTHAGLCESAVGFGGVANIKQIIWPCYISVLRARADRRSDGRRCDVPLVPCGVRAWRRAVALRDLC